MIRFRAWFCFVGSIGFLSGGAFATGPLLQYQFNQDGIEQTNTGSDPIKLITYSETTPANFVSRSPSGPSGLSSDSWLNFGAITSTRESALNDPTTPSMDFAALDNLNTFSLTAWVNDTVPPSGGHAETIFALGSNIGITFGLTPVGSPSAYEEYVKIGQGGFTDATFTVPSTDTQWTFLGVTYTYTQKTSTGTVTFYSGSPTLGSSLNSGTMNNSNSAAGSYTSLGVGNTGQTGTNQLQYGVDNVQLFGTALSASDMSTVRDQDLPETDCSAAVAVCLLLMARWRPTARRVGKSISIAVMS